ncbi:N-acetylglucosamine-6-phosphate deacetylase [Cellulomonas bogoriensis]|uniref:N-acetylglucosamine 6-phosphate deacetylase n=1 Tax=Cellulomonas bogoriensis 69B4 = DSM 16987 TaxID=1386082 RepID=A0A0A0C0Q7_9CELL|nr:amidohydrolase family protein [Cellulomonas bogoriensis]KGM13766.1 N-acetylglucosamine 6-phosphate deacetylase [Cellulomonas bogoriensis 69B4 = DSM 16987]
MDRDLEGSGGTGRGRPVVLRGRLLGAGPEVADGCVVAGERVLWSGPSGSLPPVFVAPPVSDDVVVPGLVDLHCHGGGGVDLGSVRSTGDVRRALEVHWRSGTTSVVASVMTARWVHMLGAATVLTAAAERGDLAGVHLEGPFLSPHHAGAQDGRFMRPGSARSVHEAADAFGGHLVSMTMAPEVPGVLGQDGAWSAAGLLGVLPSLGHTRASADTARAALEQARSDLAAAGARSTRPTVTHLFNGMPVPHHRDPGPVLECLAAAGRGAAVLELVADGVHLAPQTVRAVLEMVGPRSVALVSDATPAAGLGDREVPWGEGVVRVRDGVARTGCGALAGGASTLIDVLRSTVRSGVPLVEALRSATATPARVLGRADLGHLRPGAKADMVVLGPELEVRSVVRGGVVVPPVEHENMRP